jgi:hypothetical protein
MSSLLTQIRKGMTVYDNAKNEIGSVDYVHFGEEDPHRPGPETAGVSPAVRDDTNPIEEIIAEVFAPDRLPEELKSRLLREGFVRIVSYGLFTTDRFVFPNQIHAVDGDQVMLNISKQQLVEPAQL